MCFFFFKQKTAYEMRISDWSSDVCSSDLKALGGFATNGVNMTKLESYQRGGSFAATEFYADIVGKPGDPSIDNALDELGFQTKWVRLLGTYPQARARP